MNVGFSFRISAKIWFLEAIASLPTPPRSVINNVTSEALNWWGWFSQENPPTFLYTCNLINLLLRQISQASETILTVVRIINGENFHERSDTVLV